MNGLDVKRALFERMIPFNHKLAPLFIRDSLHSIIPEGTEHIFVMGIGSNIINGDSLGPFVGTLLQNLYPKHLTVVGNLLSPLDAQALVPRVSRITLPKNSFVIAIDSVLGSKRFVNSIVVRDSSLLPGSGLGKNLPPIGDCSIMGVVLDNDPTMECSIFSTNLHLIYTMATNIAKGISLAVRQYYKYPSDHPILHHC
ncbi:spore protease YyaC [Bacillus sp. sid0103]|uniref:spore protease YyaC n=1 Tax=Bacillus sp. sid0103 TaxID=2856337 RepID=UPI001C479708|nr:spore protease YyaC [Bacillus sp. sid0103]MBV7506594.1 spore protease YyaC [Bacillus sp. sid0103]